MKVTYTGINQELPAKFQAKIEARFAKLSKLLEKRGEHEAHVVVTSVRHLYKAEITINVYDHKLVAKGSDADLFTALCGALDNLETQAVKNRGKWREKHRRPENPEKAVKALKAEPAASRGEQSAQRDGSGTAVIPINVIRVNHRDTRKPMTLDEALLEMEQGRDYLVYRDAQSQAISVLVRRHDGRLDLIEE